MNFKFQLSFVVVVFQDRFSLPCLSWNSVDQAGLKLRDPPASASGRLGLKALVQVPMLKGSGR